MGIIMTFGMLVGLVLLLAQIREISFKPAVVRLLATFVLLCGLWNTFWYGLQNIQQFWGLAALGSGLAMILTAWVILTERKSLALNLVLVTVLLASFLVYLVTIVQLNLGRQLIR